MSVPEVSVNPKMIVLAREARGISQKELAEKLDTSASFISRAESDTRVLTKSTLMEISKLLSFPLDFFYQQGEANLPMSLSYRKREHVSARLLVPLEANMNLYRLHVETITAQLNPRLNFPVLDLTKLSSIGHVAKQLRKFWKMPPGPVKNLTELMEQNGIIVIAFDFGTERVDSRTIFTKSRQPIVFVNKLLLADRQRFSLAYELGHLVMHAETKPSFERDISHEANVFAASFLLPENEVKADFKDNVSPALLAELKGKWKVSMAALLFRASDTSSITDNQKRYLLQQFNQMKIRRREPPELDFPQEKPKLLRDLLTKYKTARKMTLKELAQALYLEQDEFMQRYSE